MHWKGLWALFGYYGEVVDAFIPTKRCRNGQRFGFVRFSNEKDAQRVILRLNGFFLLGKRIGMKMARYNGRRKFWRKASVQKEQEQSVDLVQEDKSEERFVNDARCEDFFIKIEPWLEKLEFNERVAWIEVSGVLLHYWNYENFKRVAGLWGKLVSVGENLTNL
ncbi:hypothetical protein GOBAR_AA38690 [Gossypium barbadense]|uniref:RRM domain-containing protein n=1 Tax=Gossypium barbadense TaxID=3634 RepID=A0A2P5VT55_GOSBA|nr:hypothetical protein GOBAR_AA38690 [Gossypium barbadense]